MDEVKENGTFIPEGFVSEEVSTSQKVSPEIESSKGGAFSGIVGALLGAVVGAVPWFLASTFANFFIGWLGFLVGLAACFGYQLFHGKRSTKFAMTTVILASIFVLFAAEIASWMYVLCSDPDWQIDAMIYGIPVAQMAWESILLPDNWGIIAPNMLIGMAIGVLGVVSAKQRIVAYTEPEKAARLQTAPLGATAMEVPDGFQLPKSFTVREPAAVTVIGVVFVVLFGGCMVLLGVVGAMEVSLAIFGTIFTVLGIWLIADGRFRRLEVDAEEFRYVSSLGRVKEFALKDIQGVSLSSLNGRICIVGHDGKKLAKVERNMKNSDILLKYLAQKKLPLMAR